MFQWYDELRTRGPPPPTIRADGGRPRASAIRRAPNPDLRSQNSARERLPGLRERGRHWAKRDNVLVRRMSRSSESAEAGKEDLRRAARSTRLGSPRLPNRIWSYWVSRGTEAYEKGVVGQALGPIIYDFTIKQSLEADLLTPFEVWHVGLSFRPTRGHEPVEFGNHGPLGVSGPSVEPAGPSKDFSRGARTQAKRGGTSAVEAERFNHPGQPSETAP